MLSLWPHVYIMIGNPHEVKSLKAAGALNADSVVVLEMRSTDEKINEARDSSAMIVYHYLYEIFSRAGMRKFIIVELNSTSNLKFLRPTITRKGDGSDLDAVLQDPYYAPSFAAGGCLSQRMLESLLYKQHFDPTISEILRAFCGMSDFQDLRNAKADGIKSSRISMINVPQAYIGQPYERLYAILSRESAIIPVGIFRNEISKALRNVLPFVITNPVPSMLLRKQDQIYVLDSRI